MFTLLGHNMDASPKVNRCLLKEKKERLDRKMKWKIKLYGTHIFFLLLDTAADPDDLYHLSDA